MVLILSDVSLGSFLIQGGLSETFASSKEGKRGALAPS